MTFDLNWPPVAPFTRKGKMMAHVTKNFAIIALATAFLLYQGWLIWDMISP